MNLSKILLLLMFAFIPTLILSAQPVTGGEWTSLTLNNNDTRFQANSTINGTNIGNLVSAWNITTYNSVSSTPIVQNGNVYFADWGGYLWSANVMTGNVNWRNNLGAGISSTPLLYNGTLYIAFGPSGTADIGGSIGILKNSNETTAVIAVNALTGNRIWFDNLGPTTLMDAIWASPIVYRNLLYIGVASQGDESLKAWKGALYGIYANNGVMAWNTLGAANAVGYGSEIIGGVDGGAGIWGSVVVDPVLNQIYFGTGNPYGGTTIPNTINSLYAYSIISLNATTGKMGWYRQIYNMTNGINGTAPYNGMVYCGTDPKGNPTTLVVSGGIASCVNSKGQADGVPNWNDYDFGSTPNLFTLTSSLSNCTFGCNALGLGSKDGNYYVLNRLTGNIIERLPVGSAENYIYSDGGIIGLGGMANTTNPAVYVPSYYNPNKNNVGGIVTEVFPSNGMVGWHYPTKGVTDGSVAVVPGAVLFGDLIFSNLTGYLYGVSTSTGATLFRHKLSAGMSGGVTVAEGHVFATGLYGSANNTLGVYAFVVSNTTTSTSTTTTVTTTIPAGPYIAMPPEVRISNSTNETVVNVLGFNFTPDSHVQFGYVPIPPYTDVMIDTTSNAIGAWVGSFRAPWTQGNYPMTGKDANGLVVNVTLIALKSTVTTVTSTSTTSTSTTSTSTTTTSTSTTSSTSTSTTSTSTTIQQSPLAIAAPAPAFQNITALVSTKINDSGATGGSGSYTYQWLEELPGSAIFANAIDCSNPTITTCTINSLSVLGNYLFALKVFDLANTSNSVISANAVIEVSPSTSSTTTTAQLDSDSMSTPCSPKSTIQVSWSWKCWLLRMLLCLSLWLKMIPQ